MENKCCFCGCDCDYRTNGNDPRPIKVLYTQQPICCDECNMRIVIPTRLDVWKTEDRLRDVESALIDENYERKTAYKALQLARKYMFNVMCAEDVPSEEWFIKCAKEGLKSE